MCCLPTVAGRRPVKSSQFRRVTRLVIQCLSLAGCHREVQARKCPPRPQIGWSGDVLQLHCDQLPGNEWLRETPSAVM